MKFQDYGINGFRYLKMSKNIVFVLLIMVSIMLSSFVMAKSEEPVANFTDAKYLYNYDGDTINFHIGDTLPVIFQNMSIRLYGIDTPELHSKNSCESTLSHKIQAFVENELKSAKKIDLVGCEKGKYFRLVCSISYDDKDLTKTLLDKRYGVPYYGDTKEKVDWCKF